MGGEPIWDARRRQSEQEGSLGVKNRLEAFSDGVIAIVITIMVMQISVPEGGALRDLLSLIPGIVC